MVRCEHGCRVGKRHLLDLSSGAHAASSSSQSSSISCSVAKRMLKGNWTSCCSPAEQRLLGWKMPFSARARRATEAGGSVDDAIPFARSPPLGAVTHISKHISTNAFDNPAHVSPLSWYRGAPLRMAREVYLRALRVM